MATEELNGGVPVVSEPTDDARPMIVNRPGGVPTLALGPSEAEQEAAQDARYASITNPTMSGDVFVTPTAVASRFDGAWLVASAIAATIPNDGGVDAMADATIEGNTVKVDGPAIWLPPNTPVDFNGNNFTLGTTAALSAETITVEVDIDVDIAYQPNVGTTPRFVNGNVIIDVSTATGVLRARWRNAAGWVGPVGVAPLNPAPKYHFRTVYTSATTSAVLEEFVGGEWVLRDTWVVTGGLYSNNLALNARQTNIGGTSTVRRWVVDCAPERGEITAETIDAAAHDATNIGGVTVARGTTGPVTTIVPAGRSVTLNPDETDTANKLTVADNPDLDISATESAVLMWVGSVGNLTVAQGLASLGGSAGGSDGFSINRAGSGATNVVARVRAAGVSTQTGVVVIPSTTERIALFAVADRVANLLRCVCVTASGVVSESTVALPATAIAPAGITAGLSTPSAVEAVAFDKTVWNQGDMVARAIQLLGSPRALTEGRAAALFAPLASPTFTGNVVVPDASAATHALNRQTSDARYARVTEWTSVLGSIINGWTAASAHVQRVGNMAYFRARDLNGAASTDSLFLPDLPGFDPDGQYDFAVAIASNSTTFTNVRASSIGLANLSQTITGARFVIAWPTTDAFPA